MTAPDLRSRLERAFMDATGAPSGHGSQTWIARLMRVRLATVNDILAGRQPPDRLEAALDLMEQGRQMATWEDGYRTGAEEATPEPGDTSTGGTHR